MKKVFVMAYLRKNFGDDLFVKMLLEKYKDIDFYIKYDKYEFIDILDKYDNLHAVYGKDTDEELYNSDVNEYDAYVYIGGSIFMEGGSSYNLSEKFYDFVKRCRENNKPFCYISCNYGPYQTQEYFELSKKDFKECTDICFRDLYSYNLFRDIETVRYAPDFAFSYNTPKVEKQKDTVGITVINLNIRNDLKDKNDKYIKFLERNIKNYISLGKDVFLFSFCKNEGDEDTIDAILKLFPNESRLHIVRYTGDIDDFLSKYNMMEYMICARFHAMILSSIAMQRMYIMSYSKKIDRVIEDLDLSLPVLHINKLEDGYDLSLEDFKSVDNEKIQKISKDAEKQDDAIRKHIV
ncbi:MAG: polysaccharide pyruvyl transferase family protein [Clostridia bacterium]|nr:polysaccharide pyruvyl transferase family protein [Clostridia bacterium]